MEDKLIATSFEFGGVYSIPEHCEVTDNKGFINWGSDNKYPQYLLDLKKKSGKHNSIIDTKAKLIGGNGINKNDITKKALSFIKNEYSTEDLEMIIAKISLDVETFGGFALNIVWNKMGDGIGSISYIDVSKIRLKKDDNDYIYYSDEWSAYRNKSIIRYPKFDCDYPTNEDENKEPSQILYVCNDERYFYPFPGYGNLSTFNCIEIEYEITNFHVNNLKKGFVPSAIVNFFNVPSDDERRNIVKTIERTYNGTNNAGKAIVNFIDGGADAKGPEITPFQPNSMDQMFIMLNQESEKGIYQGHSVTNPSLFGVMIPGQLGNTKLLSEDLRIFNSSYVVPKQNMIMKYINMLAGINKITDELKLNQYEIEVKIDVNTNDLINILTNPQLPEAAKKQMLIAIGYKEQDADKLVDSLTPQLN